MLYLNLCAASRKTLNKNLTMKSGDSLSFSGLVYYVIHLIPFLCLFICLQLKNVSGSVSLSRSKSLSGNPIHLLM